MNRDGVAARTRNATQSQSCAVCRQQRKRCDETCEMAPYLPGNRYAEFQRAQKLYGMSNIIKLIKSLEPSERKDAAESILMEANARHADPVHGSLRIVHDLKSQIQANERELQLVNQSLAFFRERGKRQQDQPQELQQFFLYDDLTEMGVADDGHHYQSTLEEGSADDFQPFNIRYINPMMDYSSQFGQHALWNFGAPGDFNALSRHVGKQTMNSGEDAGREAQAEAGPSAKGKDIFGE